MVEAGVGVAFGLEEEGARAADDEGQELRLENGLVGDEVGKAELVDEEDVADDKEVEVGAVRGQQHDGQVAVLLDLLYLLQHLHVDVHLLESVLEHFVQSPSHRPNHRNLHLADQLLDQFLSLQSDAFLRVLQGQLRFFSSGVDLGIDGLDDSAGRKDLGLHLRNLLLLIERDVGVEGPFHIREVVVFGVESQKVGVVGRKLCIFLQDILLNPVVVDLDVPLHIDLGNVDQVLLPLFFAQKLPQLLEVLALVDPLVPHEELENAGDFISPGHRLEHSLGVALVLLAQEGAEPHVGLHRKLPLQLLQLQLPFCLRDQEGGLAHFGLGLVGVPEFDDFLLDLPGSKWVAVRGTHVID